MSQTDLTHPSGDVFYLPCGAEGIQDSKASSIIQTSFYVDDCLIGADNLSYAVQLRADLNEL